MVFSTRWSASRGTWRKVVKSSAYLFTHSCAITITHYTTKITLRHSVWDSPHTEPHFFPLRPFQMCQQMKRVPQPGLRIRQITWFLDQACVCVCVCNSVTQNSKGLQIPDSVMFSLFIACPAVCASAWGHAKTHIVSQSAQSMDVWFWLNIYNLMVYHLWTTAAAHTLRESTWWQSPPTNTGGRANIYWS